MSCAAAQCHPRVAPLMESDLPPNRRQSESISQILQAGCTIEVDRQISISRSRVGQVPLSREPVSLAEVMLDVRGWIEPQAQAAWHSHGFPRFDKPYFVKAAGLGSAVLLNLLPTDQIQRPEGMCVEWSAIFTTNSNQRSDTRGTLSGAGRAIFPGVQRLGQEGW